MKKYFNTKFFFIIFITFIFVYEFIYLFLPLYCQNRFILYSIVIFITFLIWYSLEKSKNTTKIFRIE